MPFVPNPLRKPTLFCPLTHTAEAPGNMLCIAPVSKSASGTTFCTAPGSAPGITGTTAPQMSPTRKRKELRRVKQRIRTNQFGGTAEDKRLYQQLSGKIPSFKTETPEMRSRHLAAMRSRRSAATKPVSNMDGTWVPNPKNLQTGKLFKYPRCKCVDSWLSLQYLLDAGYKPADVAFTCVTCQAKQTKTYQQNRADEHLRRVLNAKNGALHIEWPDVGRRVDIWGELFKDWKASKEERAFVDGLLDDAECSVFANTNVFVTDLNLTGKFRLPKDEQVSI